MCALVLLTADVSQGTPYRKPDKRGSDYVQCLISTGTISVYRVSTSLLIGLTGSSLCVHMSAVCLTQKSRVRQVREMIEELMKAELHSDDRS